MTHLCRLRLLLTAAAVAGDAETENGENDEEKQ